MMFKRFDEFKRFKKYFCKPIELIEPHEPFERLYSLSLLQNALLLKIIIPQT